MNHSAMVKDFLETSFPPGQHLLPAPLLQHALVSDSHAMRRILTGKQPHLGDCHLGCPCVRHDPQLLKALEAKAALEAQLQEKEAELGAMKASVKHHSNQTTDKVKPPPLPPKC